MQLFIHSYQGYTIPAFRGDMLGLEKEILNMFEYKKIPLLGLVWPLYMHYVITYFILSGLAPFQVSTFAFISWSLVTELIGFIVLTVYICEYSEIILIH